MEALQAKPRRCLTDEFAVWIASLIPCLKPLRYFNGTMPVTLELSSISACDTFVGWLLLMLLAFVDAWLRGASQVVIINNPFSGIFIVASLFFPFAEVGAHGLLGLTGATAAAFALKLDQQAITSGLFGYNGLLVGMAFGTFLSRSGSWDAAVLAACVLVGGMSTLVQLALGNALVPTFQTPPFTLAFNLTFLLFLLASAHWSRFRMPHHVELEGVPVAMPESLLNATAGAPMPSVDALWLLTSSLISVGQIFLCESMTSGALILGGMAVSSRIAAAGAYAGALLANMLALGLGADETAIAAGLWGYSSSLTAIAVLTFFKPSRHGCLMACLGVALTVLFDGALRSVFAPVHMPIGTLPFCFSALLLMLTHSKIPGFEVIPLADVSTAEDHLYSVRISRSTHAHAPTAEVVITSATKDNGGNGGGNGSGQGGGHGGGGLSINIASAEADSPESVVPADGGFVSPFHAMREAVIVGLPASPLSRSRGSSLHGGGGFMPPPGGSPFPQRGGCGLAGLRASGSSPNLAADHVAKKLAVMTSSAHSGSGHSGRAYELAMRAASGLGLSGASDRWASSPLSREVTAHGGESFDTLIEGPEVIRMRVEGDAAEAPRGGGVRDASPLVKHTPEPSHTA